MPELLELSGSNNGAFCTKFTTIPSAISHLGKFLFDKQVDVRLYSIDQKKPGALEEGRVVIETNYSFDASTFKIAVCGQNIEGAEDWKEPFYLEQQNGNWSVAFNKKKAKEPVLFKYILVNKFSGEIIWEKDVSDGPNRTTGKNYPDPQFF